MCGVYSFVISQMLVPFLARNASLEELTFFLGEIRECILQQGAILVSLNLFLGDRKIPLPSDTANE